MTTYYVVPERNDYGDWAIKRSGGIKVSDAQTQSTAVNSVRNTYGNEGDQVYVYGSRKNEIVDSFTIT